MGYYQIHVGGGFAHSPQQFFDGGRHAGHCVAEHFRAVHHQAQMFARLQQFAVERTAGAARQNVEDAGQGAVGAGQPLHHAGLTAPARRAHHQGPRPVPEQHRRVAVGQVDQAGYQLHPHHQHVFGMEGDAGPGHVQRLDKPGASAAAQVVAGDFPASQLVLQVGGRVGGFRLRGVGGDDDLVDVGGGHPGVGDGRPGGVGRHGEGSFPGGGEPAFFDAGALRDPLVAGVQPLLPIPVGHHPLRHISPEPEQRAQRALPFLVASRCAQPPARPDGLDTRFDTGR